MAYVDRRSSPEGQLALSSLLTSVYLCLKDFRAEDGKNDVLAFVAIDTLIQAIVLGKRVVLMGADGIHRKRLIDGLFREVPTEKIDELFIFQPPSRTESIPDDLIAKIKLVTQAEQFKAMLSELFYEQLSNLPQPFTAGAGWNEAAIRKWSASYTERVGRVHLGDLWMADQLGYRLLPSIFEREIAQATQDYCHKQIISAACQMNEKMRDLWATKADCFPDLHGRRASKNFLFFFVGCLNYCDEPHNVAPSELIKGAFLWRVDAEAKWARASLNRKAMLSARDIKHFEGRATQTLDALPGSSVRSRIRSIALQAKQLAEKDVNIGIPYGIGASIGATIHFLLLPSKLLPVSKEFRFYETLIHNAYVYRALPSMFQGNLGLNRRRAHTTGRIVDDLNVGDIPITQGVT